MNIKIHYSRGGVNAIKKPIDIKISLQKEQHSIFEQYFVVANSGVLEFFCDYPPENITCCLHCNDLDIYHHPLIVDMLEFDNFYQLKTHAHHGTNYYDDNFLDYAKQNNILLENNKFNSCLFFTGNLSYQWTRPITQMIMFRPKSVLMPSGLDQ